MIKNNILAKFRNLLKTACILLVCCNTYTYAQNLQQFDFGFARKMGSISMDGSEHIAVDKLGNVYTTGWHNGPADLGDGSLTFPAGMQITKHDAGGNFVWAKNIGNSTNTRGYRIATDDSGNVYVTGYFSLYSGTIDFDPGPDSFKLTSNGMDDIFILKLNTDGKFIWANKAGSRSDNFGDAGFGLAIDSLHNVYICGQYADYAYFDTITLRTAITIPPQNPVTLNPFVAKADANGKWVWAKGMTTTANASSAQGVDVDHKGNVYVTGNFGNTLSLGSHSITSAGGMDVFVTKLDNAGNFLWAKGFGGPGGTFTWDQGMALAVDLEGGVYTTGYFSSTADFDPGTDTFTMGRQGTGGDIFIQKLNTDGNFVWANRMGGRQTEMGYDIAVDDYKNVYLASYIRDTFITVNTTFDTLRHLSTNGGYDILLAKFDSIGQHVCSANMGSPGSGGGSDEGAYGIAVDASGNIYATGIFNGTADFNPGPGTFNLTNYVDALNPGISWDIFVLKLVCTADSANLTVNIQCADTTINGVTLTESGNYTQVLKSRYGCDSILSIALTIDRKLKEEPIISVNEFELSSGAYATYQWLLNGQAIPGATNRTLNVTENGEYRVYVTDERGCSDTSDVYIVNNVSVQPVSILGKQVWVYPNPSHDLLHIQAPISVNAMLSSIEGRTLLFEENVSKISLRPFSEGVYFLRITDQQGRLIKVEKIIKQ